MSAMGGLMQAAVGVPVRRNYRIMSEEILLTQEGYDKLEAERDELISVRRKEVSERLKEAISYGDLSENAEYDAAKDEQAELEERIQKLETMMRKLHRSPRSWPPLSPSTTRICRST
jgi:hypothetical protein